MDGNALHQVGMSEQNDKDWLRRIEDLGELEGYYEPLGAHHHALFADRGPVLLVTFELREAIRARDEQLPLGYVLAEAANHSSLTLVADQESWFRDSAIYAYFDRLIDEGFFEDFDRVVFYGVGSCGYAAAAYSVAAPGATVIALAPQATLEPRLTAWEHRFEAARRLCFTDRYGFAPDMLEGVGAGYVIYDPAIAADAMHAALLARPCVTLLPCRFLGANAELLLSEFDLLEPMLSLACEGQFSAADFWQLYRARRTSPRYLRQLLGRLDMAGRPWLEALACRNAVMRLNGPRFRARLATLEEELALAGHSLPGQKLHHPA